MNIPIQTVPSREATITVATLNQPIFVIGPEPHPHRFSYILDSMAHRIRTALINALVVAGWIMGLIAMLAIASPTFEGWAEDVFVRVLYALT